MAGRGRGRGRGGRNTALESMAREMNITPAKLKNMNFDYEPEKTFPDFILPRATKLSEEETTVVKIYKNLRRRIMDETPFYIVPRKRAVDDPEDDGESNWASY
jgi:hypothetical protein